MLHFILSRQNSLVKRYTSRQLVELKVFHLNSFLCHFRRVETPNQFNLKERQIKIYFQNLRSTRKYKKDEKLKDCALNQVAQKLLPVLVILMQWVMMMMMIMTLFPRHL
jgi:hypothetical protein